MNFGLICVTPKPALMAMEDRMPRLKWFEAATEGDQKAADQPDGGVVVEQFAEEGNSLEPRDIRVIDLQLANALFPTGVFVVCAGVLNFSSNLLSSALPAMSTTYLSSLVEIVSAMSSMERQKWDKSNALSHNVSSS